MDRSIRHLRELHHRSLLVTDPSGDAIYPFFNLMPLANVFNLPPPWEAQSS
jgi:hypothetical protein